MRTPQEIPLNSSARPLKGYLAHGFVDVFVHHYADFSGRTGRKAYWLAVATVFTAYLPLFCISWKVDPALAAGHAAYWLFLYCYGTLSIAIIIPCIASTIRSLHADRAYYFAADSFNAGGISSGQQTTEAL